MKRKNFYIDTSNFFCWNEQCSDFKVKGNKNIIYSHHDGKNKDIVYLKCTKCMKKFSENKGTVFYNKKIKRETIERILKSTSEGMGIRATARIFDINKNTVLNYVKDAGKHSEDLEKFFSKT